MYIYTMQIAWGVAHSDTLNFAIETFSNGFYTNEFIFDLSSDQTSDSILFFVKNAILISSDSIVIGNGAKENFFIRFQDKKHLSVANDLNVKTFSSLQVFCK